MSGVDIKKTLAYQIALKLDKMDEGGKDSKINKSIWDKFAQEYNGKEINESMTLEQATKSITTYLIRKASELGTTAEKLAQEWLGKDSNEQSENRSNNRSFEIENNTVEQNPTIKGQDADFSKAKISPIKIESPFVDADEPIIEKVPLVKMEYENPTIKSQEADLSNVKIKPQKIKSPFVPNYRIEENKKGETLYIYESKTGRKTIVNHGTEEIPALDISYNVGDAKVSVQSTIKLNEIGKVILDENGYAGTITVEKNGEKTVVPLEINMRLLPNRNIISREEIRINYNEKMQEANTFIQTFTDRIFKDLSPDALDYFTKECDVLRFNLLDSMEGMETGRFDSEGDANQIDDNDEKRRTLNRLSLHMAKDNIGTYTFQMQNSFLHELGHGVSVYHNLPTSKVSSQHVDLAQISQTWADTFNDVYKYVQDNNLNSNGAFNYMLKPEQVRGFRDKSDPKQELFAEFFAYSMGIKADGMNYSTLFETIKKNNPELFSKMTNAFNEILTEINNKQDIERKFSTDAYQKYYDEEILGEPIEPVKEPEVPPTGEYQYGKNFTNDFKQAYEEIMQNDQITSSQKEKLTKNKDHILNQIGYFAGRHVDSCSDMKNMIKTEGSVSAWISSYSSQLQNFYIGSKEYKSIISDVLKVLMEKYKNLQ